MPSITGFANLSEFIAAHAAHLTALRRDIHAHPELRYEEQRTSDLVLHNPSYDFNDELIPLGGSMWVRLAEAWFA